MDTSDTEYRERHRPKFSISKGPLIIIENLISKDGPTDKELIKTIEESFERSIEANIEYIIN